MGFLDKKKILITACSATVRSPTDRQAMHREARYLHSASRGAGQDRVVELAAEFGSRRCSLRRRQ